MDELMKASHKLAEEVYKSQTQAQQGAGATADAGAQSSQQAQGGAQESTQQDASKKDDVIDAEFKDDNK